MLKKILKNNNYYIKDNSLYVDNKIIKEDEVIEYICSQCKKLHIQKYHKNILERFNGPLICTRCRVKQTNLNKFGVEYSFQSKELKEKIKKTILKKYGVENISQNKEIQEKKKQTSIKNYGTEYPLQSKEIKEKIKNSMLEKYGSEIPYSFGSEKYINLIQDKYGVENISQNKEIKEKIKKIILEKYGVENISQIPETKEKVKQTNIKKYGISSFLEAEKCIQNAKKNKHVKSYNKYLMLEDVKPLFTLEEYLEKKEKYEKFKWKCKKCGNEFEGYYENGAAPRCPICYPVLNGYSNSEKEVADYCKSLGLKIVENDRQILGGLEIDIYIPSHQLAIEYNGLYYHSTRFKLDKCYHQNKVKLAQEKGVRLLHIWEHEWLEEQEQTKQVIQYYINNLQEEIVPQEPKLYNIHDNLIWI